MAIGSRHGHSPGRVRERFGVRGQAERDPALAARGAVGWPGQSTVAAALCRRTPRRMPALASPCMRSMSVAHVAPHRVAPLPAAARERFGVRQCSGALARASAHSGASPCRGQSGGHRHMPRCSRAGQDIGAIAGSTQLSWDRRPRLRSDILPQPLAPDASLGVSRGWEGAERGRSCGEPMKRVRRVRRPGLQGVGPVSSSGGPRPGRFNGSRLVPSDLLMGRLNGSPIAPRDHKLRRAAFPGCRFGGLSSPPDQLGAGKPPEPAGRKACLTGLRFIGSNRERRHSCRRGPNDVTRRQHCRRSGFGSGRDAPVASRDGCEGREGRAMPSCPWVGLGAPWSAKEGSPSESVSEVFTASYLAEKRAEWRIHPAK